MKLLQIRLVAIVVIMLVTLGGYGQQTLKISGRVVDSLTHEAIPFATVTLMDQQSKTPIKAMQTDTIGNLVLGNLTSGTFILQISYVGYVVFLKDNIMINPTTGNLNLGVILMTESNINALKEVVVTSKKDALQIIDGKKVFSVNQSLISKGGNAADLLQNVPSLQIDGDGNVSLRGSTGVKVLIDGKPSIVANGDITQILQSIPASSIENVEVIPNPSSKYDANGEGIINIILKKNSKTGFNAATNIGAGTRDNYNGDASLSYQNSSINLYGNYSLKNGNTYSNGFQNMTFLKPTDSVRYSNETFPSITRNKIQFVKAGIEYALTPKSVLGIAGSYNSRNTHRGEVLSIVNLNANGVAIQSSNRNNTTNNNGNSYEFDLDYSQHFQKPKEELTFNFSYAYGNFKNDQEYRTSFNAVSREPVSSLDTPLISDISNKTTNYNIQADYILPIGKTGTFSAGYRSQITYGNNNQYAYNVLSAVETPFYTFTDLFSSNNQVHAVYLNYQDKIANFSYQVGIRVEDSHLNATYVSYDANNILFADPVKVPSVGLYPSVLLSDKLKDDAQLQLTFTKRVSRPTGREINSATDFSDPVNYDKGNPGLKPESIIDLELDYNKTWRSISFTSGIYYNNINNVIKHVESDPVNGVVTTTSENLKRSTTTGLELIGHFDLLKGWDLTANANIFNRDNDAAPQYGILASNGISWNANITSNVIPIKSLSFQIRADYRAADMVLQDNNHAAFGLDGAAKYNFLENRASFTFNANDIFNSRHWAFLRSSNDLLLDFERRTVSSRATLTFSYRFGTGNSKQIKKR